MPSMTPAATGSANASAAATGSAAASAAATGSASATVAITDGKPLCCSDVDLFCSDELVCADDGAVASAPSTGTMVHA